MTNENCQHNTFELQFTRFDKKRLCFKLMNYKRFDIICYKFNLIYNWYNINTILMKTVMGTFNVLQYMSLRSVALMHINKR